MGELYGEYNLLTNEWTDGLASTIVRAAVADTSLDRKWVVFDGPVDAVWIENMNTGGLGWLCCYVSGKGGSACMDL
jgi:dynein heavy chain